MFPCGQFAATCATCRADPVIHACVYAVTPQAIKAGNTLYVSGQIGIVPGTKDFASEGVEGQTEQVWVGVGVGVLGWWWWGGEGLLRTGCVCRFM